MKRTILVMMLAPAFLGACATLGTPDRDPLQVTVAGIEPLQGEEFELRLMVKLRMLNPNDVAIDFDGAYVKLEVQGKTFATGASDATGSVPRFGETIVSVPVTVSVLRMARQVMGMADGKPVDQIRYSMTGKLNRATTGSVRFEAQGEFSLKPASPAEGPVS